MVMYVSRFVLHHKIENLVKRLFRSYMSRDIQANGHSELRQGMAQMAIQCNRKSVQLSVCVDPY